MMTVIHQAHLKTCAGDSDCIRVGATDYTIVYRPYAEMDGAHGRLNTALAILELLDGMNRQVELITLWHETVHAILCASGHEDQNEQLVESLAHGIVQVLRDNPRLYNVTR